MIKYLENSEDFTSLLIEGVVLVDFYTEWCGPCKMIAPILEELNVMVVKVNTDEFAELAIEYKIMSIPTLLFFKDGKEIQREIGFRTKEQIESAISSIN